MATLAGADEYQNGQNSFASALTLSNGQILFVSRTNDGRCLKLTVFRKSGFLGRDFTQIWSAEGTPSLDDFCSPVSCRPPTVFAVKNDKPSPSGESPIFVASVPRPTSPEDHACDNNLLVRYRNHGDGYEIAGEEIAPAARGVYDCLAQTDQSLLQGDDIAVIEVLPALAVRRFAMAIREIDGGLIAEKIEIPRRTLDASTSSRPSDCRPLPLKKVSRLHLDSKTLSEFLEDLKRIDLRSDRCPRQKRGECAWILDGIGYRVVLKGTRPINLTDIEGEPKIRSENPELYEWVQKLLKDANMNVRR